ncbi:hypothetical protein [Streptomyces sp. NPDC001985]|uniref:hypothetical protein n=1 Tax=Streptomyces sp. NPDC001985 TaxID=3154406 RepID=UPI0033300E72
MDFTVIANALEVNDGITRVSMRFIKGYAAPSRARLSLELCEEIAAALDRQGMVTLPRRLPTSENESVFVIRKDSPLGQAIRIAAIVAALDKLDTSPIAGMRDKFPDARKYLT